MFDRVLNTENTEELAAKKNSGTNFGLMTSEPDEVKVKFVAFH